MIRLACAQMRVEAGHKAQNLARAADWIAESARQGAQLVLLPETLDLGWTHPTARAQASAVPDGDSCGALAEAARRAGVYVCAGLVERDGERVYNSAVLLDDRGRLLLRHRKINELEIGLPYYDRGDRLNVVDTPLGRLGVMICADARAEGAAVTRSLGLMGATGILSPCAWAVPADHDNDARPYGQEWLDAYAPVAQRFGCWIAGVSNVGPIPAGPWAGRLCIGRSLVVAPDGAPAAWGPYGPQAEALLRVDLPG